MNKLQFTRTQFVYLALGTLLAVVFAVVAAPNFNDIYNSQKDFTIGLLLAGVTYCLTRAFASTEQQLTEEMAEAMIRERRSPRIDGIIADEVRRELHESEVILQLGLARRNVDAAKERLAEYVDSRSGDFRFPKQLALIQVIADDLDKTIGNLIVISNTLLPADGSALDFDPADRLRLVSACRDLREALNRRNQVADFLLGRPETVLAEGGWSRDLFDVMSADIVKATQTLVDLVSPNHSHLGAEVVLITVVGYIEAALKRASEFRAYLESTKIEIPKIFEVLEDDLKTASEKIRQTQMPKSASMLKVQLARVEEPGQLATT